MSERRRVNFRESPPSSGASSRYASDSGVGSVSDFPGSSAGGPASSAGSSRYSKSGNSVNQWTDLAALQEAYRAVLAERDQWQTRAEELEEEVSRSHKQYSEVEAKWRAIVDRNEQLEDDKKKLFKEKKALAEEVNSHRDEIDSLREELAEANARFNELQRNVGPSFAAGTSPHSSGSIHGNMSGNPEPKSSRHSRDGKGSSSSAKGSGSGSSSGSSSHSSGHSSGQSSSRAKVGSSSSSTSTAKISRQNSKHESAKDQKTRLSQRFDPKDDSIHDSTASASSSAASTSSHKHHKSGSSGNGSSGSNGSSASADSGARPPRTRRPSQSYVEPFGPGAAAQHQRPVVLVAQPSSPNKGVPRTAPPLTMMPGQGGAVPAGHYGHTAPYSSAQPHYGAPPPAPLVSPRGDKSSIHPTVMIYDEATGDPYHDAGYYSGYAPRDPRLPRR